MYIDMKKDFFTVVGLFLVIMLVALWFSSTPSYVPYSSTIFSKYGKYEPFTSRNSVEYSKASDNSAIDSPVTNYLLSPSTGATAVSGFGGLGVFNNSDVVTKEKIDIYSQAEGSLSTEGYGYYNSRGSLVFDQNMRNMLQTRGGNSSGASSTVGGSPA